MPDPTKSQTPTERTAFQLKLCGQFEQVVTDLAAVYRQRGLDQKNIQLVLARLGRDL